MSFLLTTFLEKIDMINVLDLTVSSVPNPGWTEIVEDQTGLMTVYVNVGKSG